jgi:hypothetical protein
MLTVHLLVLLTEKKLVLMHGMEREIYLLELFLTQFSFGVDIPNI